MNISTTPQWIGAPAQGQGAQWLRHEFDVGGCVAQAHLHICGLGYHEPWLNGERVGDHVLDPAQTDYESRVFYVTHDVSDMLCEGRNAVGIMLGHGWYHQDKVWDCDYGQPRLFAEIHIRYKDAPEQVVKAEAGWRCADSPVTSDNIYAGEWYDARREQDGWARTGFDDTGWQHAIELPAPGGKLIPQSIPPMRRIEALAPVEIRKMGNGTHVVDIGQNISGWCRLRVNAAAGTEIMLRFAEELDATGNIDTASTGVFATGVEQKDGYICRGGGVEEWEPRFCYHGFRYVEVSGWPGALTAENLTGVVVHTDLQTAGGFSCSDERLNTLHRMALWTHRTNLHSIPEDCPARERCGWLGDAHIVAEFSMWNFEGKAFWKKYLGDIETTRLNNGGLPSAIAPGRRGTDWVANPDWAAALILIPWYLYFHYGDAEVLTRHHEGMTRLIEHFLNQADGYVLAGGYGDWFDPGGDAIVTHTEPSLTTTLWFLRCAEIMADVERIVGDADMQQEYGSLAACIRAAFVDRFYDKATGTFGSQTADAMALHFSAVPAGETARVVDSLVASIREHDMHQITGIMGVRYLYEALSQNGHGDVVLALMHQDSYPGFGDLIGRGATTLWESWGESALDVQHGMRSRNHPMFGGYDNWFFNTLAGICPDPETPGFKHFFVEPHPIKGIDWIRCYHDSPYGRIDVDWRYDSGALSGVITVPEGSVASFKKPGCEEILELQPGKHKV